MNFPPPPLSHLRSTITKEKVKQCYFALPVSNEALTIEVHFESTASDGGGGWCELPPPPLCGRL